MSEYDPNYVPKKVYFLAGLKCLVFNSEGKILLLKRSDKVPRSGQWNLVGGSLEDDEDPVEGLKREAKEEADLELLEIQPIFTTVIKDGIEPVLIIAYRAKASSNNVTINWEHDGFVWATKEEALKLDLTDLTKKIIDAI
jgi:ADP-ribose pyrophosphatase YjhB (NUDIX family)